MTTHRIPAPQAQAFVACRKITNDPQTGEIVITGPVSHWRYDPVVPVPPRESRASDLKRWSGGAASRCEASFQSRIFCGGTVWKV